MKGPPRGAYLKRGNRKLPTLDINGRVSQDTICKIRSVLQRATCDWGVAWMLIYSDGRAILSKVSDSIPAEWAGTYSKNLSTRFIREDVNHALEVIRNAAKADQQANQPTR